MKFFIDTADVEEIRKANAMGVLDGVTTNPSLIAKTGRDFHEVLKEICSIVDGPISAEVVSLDADGMIAEGRELAKIHKNIVVKIPMTTEGLRATKALSSAGIPVNVTLIFSASQGLLAAKAGATYASPFIGRLDDISHDGMELISELVTIYENFGFATQVLAASCRHPIHVVQSALLGSHVATIPFSVIAQLAKHPLTDIGLAKFMADWEKVPKPKAEKPKAAVKAGKPKAAVKAGKPKAAVKAAPAKAVKTAKPKAVKAVKPKTTKKK